jgi:ribonuclease III
MTVKVANSCPDSTTGDWTVLEQNLVKRGAVAAAARRWSLDRHILYGRGEEKNRSSASDGTLADVFFALLGAVLLDHGQWTAMEVALRAADELISRHGGGELAIATLSRKSHKVLLQELVQQRFGQVPIYRHRRIGPDHAPTFVASVVVCGKPTGEGRGESKRSAEGAAAASAYKTLSKKSNL